MYVSTKVFLRLVTFQDLACTFACLPSLLFSCALRASQTRRRFTKRLFYYLVPQILVKWSSERNFTSAPQTRCFFFCFFFHQSSSCRKPRLVQELLFNRFHNIKEPVCCSSADQFFILLLQLKRYLQITVLISSLFFYSIYTTICLCFCEKFKKKNLNAWHVR